MTRVLLTAFEPYDRWSENSSWLALAELTRWYDGAAQLTTRRYPVDLAVMSDRLQQDLQADYDFAVHLGQSPGSTQIKLEVVGLNTRTDGAPLIEDAADAYRSPLPLADCAQLLIEANIPAAVSHHAGTYLCNAALFLSQHYAREFGLQTKSLFIHIPLTPAQAARDPARPASMSTPLASAAVAIVLERLRACARVE